MMWGGDTVQVDERRNTKKIKNNHQHIRQIKNKKKCKTAYKKIANKHRATSYKKLNTKQN